ncbi:MAG: hypothetical protein QOK19_632 [Solirubrobacteraceae bacterium]|jgi:hypothetical protein|nr:hypothetical protein [Solirubrobacteraceae bacterium]
MLARRMKDLHAILGIATLALNALAAVWGAVAWSRSDPSVSFWYLLRVAQLSVVLEVVLGVVLLAEGKKPPDGLHYVYAISPLVIAFVTEGMRVRAAQAELENVEDPDALPRREQVLLARRVVVREIGIMTVGLILIVTLLLRAAQSGGAF